MKIYIAAPYSLRTTEATDTMHLLESQGHTVTSRWIKTPQTESNARHAQEDLDDVASADILLALNTVVMRSGGGRHVELGYAIALGKQIVLVGVRTNVFHHLDCVRVIERIEDL